MKYHKRERIQIEKRIHSSYDKKENDSITISNAQRQLGPLECIKIRISTADGRDLPHQKNPNKRMLLKSFLHIFNIELSEDTQICMHDSGLHTQK